MRRPVQRIILLVVEIMVLFMSQHHRLVRGFIARNTRAQFTTHRRDGPRFAWLDEEAKWEVKSIGYAVSAYEDRFDTPKQATIKDQGIGKKGGEIQLYPQYKECLDHLDGFDYIWVVALFQGNHGYKDKIRPMPREDMARKPPQEVGLFCSRAPHRPNPIGLSALRISKVDKEKCSIEVDGLDFLNHTPILDVKPYVPAFDSFPDARAGWMDDIIPDPIVARERGYQSITNARGRRTAAARRKRRATEKANADNEMEGKSTDTVSKESMESTPEVALESEEHGSDSSSPIIAASP
jgi:tRNA-Thr(GGU) m(6)t(6)A37 methyltransferase TsaA